MRAPAANVVRLPTARRQWDAGKPSRHPDWNVASRPVDVDIRYGLGLIRARARQLAQDSDHARGFLRIVRNNIVGASGFVLQSRAMMSAARADNELRRRVESEWAEWGRRGNCEITGRYSWRGLQRHVIETVARDGEAFVRLIYPYRNRWGLCLQVIDPEAVDIGYDGEYQGREIRMGVELDADRRPAAYWINAEPKIYRSSYRVGERYRVPADQMLHCYLPEFCWQTRGVPWMATSALRLHMIRGTEDAEVEASRASAAKFAAYEATELAPPPEPRTGANNQPLVDADGNPISSDPGKFLQDMEPGSMEVVPYGYKLNLLDPQHPNAAMPEFLKWGLRSVATGLGVSYNTLGNDAEGVNYTSLRFFLGVERDHWMEAQDWFEGELPEPVRRLWTDQQSFLGTLGELSPRRSAQVHAIRWQPRRWEGPDPAKQAQADEQDLAIGATSLTQICARKGVDFDDLIAQRVAELAQIKAAAEDAGLTLADVLPHLGTGRPVTSPKEVQNIDQTD